MTSSQLYGDAGCQQRIVFQQGQVGFQADPAAQLTDPTQKERSYGGAMNLLLFGFFQRLADRLFNFFSRDCKFGRWWYNNHRPHVHPQHRAPDRTGSDHLGLHATR